VRLSSPSRLLNEAAATARRFPFVLAAAVAAGICAASVIDRDDPSLLLRALMATQLGIPLLLALALLGERRGGTKLLLSLLGTMLILLYFLTLPSNLLDESVTRFFQLNVVAHLLVAFLPYILRDEPNGFWQFNKTLFLRLLNSLLFTGVLIIGLNVAILALDKLFGLSVDDNLYARLDLILVFVFNTWYFLSAIPGDFAALERSRDYPRGLKVFAQFILAPLVAVYLALLTAYLVRVIITAEWPSGWIGWLVSCVAAAGLLSLALLHPLAKQRENRWIATYARVYFILMLPAVGMQIMAIAKRVGQYGFTENRYFIGVLALWLLGVSIAGALNRLKRLEPLPATLGLIALLASFGPWGAYSISRSSQVNRLESVLAPAGLLVDGRLARSQSRVSSETRREASAILYYLMKSHGHRAIDPLLSPDQSEALAGIADSLRHPQRELSQKVMEYMGQDYQTNWMRDRMDRGWYSAKRKRGSEAATLDGFSHLQPVSFPDRQSQDFKVAGRSFLIRQVGSDIMLDQGGEPTLTIPLEPLFVSLRGWIESEGGVSVPGSLMTAEARGESLRVRLLLDSIEWHEQEDGSRIHRLRGNLLIGQ
jgi:hypothetical protein